MRNEIFFQKIYWHWVRGPRKKAQAFNRNKMNPLKLFVLEESDAGFSPIYTTI